MHNGYGRSLHIGVKDLDRTHYGTQFASLKGPENDAWFMAEMAKHRGFTDVRVLTGTSATAARVIAEIQDAGRTLPPGSLFVLTFAGHGMQFPNTDPPEVDAEQFDQAWCLYDRALLDDEVYALCLPYFAQGTRVVAVFDACHSQTMIARSLRMTMRFVREPRTYRFIGAEAELETRNRNATLYEHIQRSLSRLPRQKPLADVGAIAACRDDQRTRDDDPHGVFTSALREVWDNGRFAGTYLELFDALTDKLKPEETTPTWCCTETLSATFWTDPAFVITPPPPAAT